MKINNLNKKHFKSSLINILSKLEYCFDTIGSKKKYSSTLIDSAIKKFKQKEGTFGGFALTEHSVRAFALALLSQAKSRYSIVEFGSGQSTFFISNLIQEGINILLNSFEHDKDWTDFVFNAVSDCSSIKIQQCELRKVDDDIFEEMFLYPNMAMKLWEQYSKPVEKSLYKDTRMHNAFYSIPEDALSHTEYLDGLILDGPHGNGRSLSFPLLFNHLHPGTIVLIDDYHHYPFLKYMARILDYRLLGEQKFQYSNKGWALLEIMKIKQGSQH